MKVEEAKELEMDESELLDLLDFDDDMWFGFCCLNLFIGKLFF